MPVETLTEEEAVDKKLGEETIQAIKSGGVRYRVGVLSRSSFLIKYLYGVTAKAPINILIIIITSPQIPPFYDPPILPFDNITFTLLITFHHIIISSFIFVTFIITSSHHCERASLYSIYLLCGVSHITPLSYPEAGHG